MTLTLTITNLDKLDNGESTRLVLDRHGAVIGRSPHADWSLPDPRNYISSTHCEVEFRDGDYWLVDRSTNGLFVNGAKERLAAPHRLVSGDELAIGHYRVSTRVDSAVAAKAAAPPPEPAGGWNGWDAPAPAALPADTRGMGFDAPPAAPAPVAPPVSDWQAEAATHREGWTAEPAGTWGSPAAQDDWSAPASALSGRGAMAESWTPPAPAPVEDVWGKLEESNRVDWGRGGFDGRWGAPAPATTPPVAAGAAAPRPAPAASPDAAAWAALLASAGLKPADIGPPEKAGATAGALLHRLVSGLVVMLEARARAKAQLGAQGTAFNPDGNNPLKFSRTPDQALLQLLGPPQRGYLDAERAVDDAFKDLQAHQMATLAAMQGALRSTLDRFSPQAIRDRAESRGLLSKILPGAREANLWKAYEREFEGVVEGSDEAFMDVFAKAFREAYERASGGGRW
jgi:type VI secretion system FHA domain protein